MTAPAGAIALTCPIAGNADVMTSEWSIELGKADISVGDAQTRHDIVVSPRGACIVIVGSPAAWSMLAGKGRVGTQQVIALFPAIHRCARGICRRLLRFVRHCLDNDQPGSSSKQLAHQLACLVDELQSAFAPMIARCPGSSLSRKRAVFLRLQRVRNRIGACAHEEIDVAALALMANYSVGHFITTFRSVFDETPYSHLSRYRLESASALLSGSTLGIGDIARAIGFQSRSSFSRAIRKHLGSSASEFRENSGRGSGAPDAEDEISKSFVADVRHFGRSPRLANEAD